MERVFDFSNASVSSCTTTVGILVAVITLIVAFHCGSYKLKEKVGALIFLSSIRCLTTEYNAASENNTTKAPVIDEVHYKEKKKCTRILTTILRVAVARKVIN